MLILQILADQPVLGCRHQSLKCRVPPLDKTTILAGHHGVPADGTSGNVGRHDLNNVGVIVGHPGVESSIDLWRLVSICGVIKIRDKNIKKNMTKHDKNMTNTIQT